MLAETYIDPYMSPEFWEWAVWYVFGDPAVQMGFVVFTIAVVLADFIDQYLTAFHRKSGNRLMYDGEPEEYRWSWKEKGGQRGPL